MYTYEDLVAALQSGKTVDDIAAQMTKELNAAKEEYDRQAAEETKKANELAQKRQVVANLYTAIGQYLTVFHPNSAISKMFAASDGPDKEDLDQLAEQLDSLVETFEAMKDLTTLLSDVDFDSPVFAKYNVKLDNFVNKTVKIDDPIEAFLNKNVRKK